MIDLNCMIKNIYNEKCNYVKNNQIKYDFRWNSVSNDELLQQQVDVFDRHYSTSSQYLLPSVLNAGNHNNIMMVNPARGNIANYRFRDLFCI